jgi:hypothetical protein
MPPNRDGLWLRLLFGEPTSAPTQPQVDEAHALAEALSGAADELRAEAAALLLRIILGSLPHGVLALARQRLAQVQRPSPPSTKDA